MKRMFLNKTIFYGICAIFFIFVGFSIVQVSLHTKQTHNKRDVTLRINKCRVAILLPISHPSLEKIKQGFIDTLKKCCCRDFEFNVFNGNGNRSLMILQAKEVALGDYDLICPISTVPAQLIKSFCEKSHINIPIVYGGVSYPVRAGLIKTIESSGNNVTGVFDSVPNDKQLEYIFLLKPDIKTIMLVYDPDLEEQKNNIEKIVEAKGVKLKCIKVFASQEIFEKVSSQLSGVDLILVLKDNTVVSAIDILIRLCERNNITLMVSDLDSVEKGAVLGYGVSEYDIGVSTAEKAIQIIKYNKLPSDIPSSLANGFKFIVNLKTAEKQGLKIDSDKLALINDAHILK